MVNVGLIGLGTVGSGVLEILTKEKEQIRKKTGIEINLKKILVKDINKKRDFDFDKSLLTEKAADILDDEDISIVVELTSGSEDAAAQYILNSLDKGKHVVTAGKAAVAKHWNDIFRKAYEKDRLTPFL